MPDVLDSQTNIETEPRCPADCQPGGRLAEILRSLPQFVKEMQEQHFVLGHGHFPQHPLQFANCPDIWHCSV